MTTPERDSDREESRGFDLPPELVDELRAALEEGRAEAVQALVAERHSADVAQFLDLISPEERRRFIELMRGRLDPEVLVELDEAVRDEVIEQLGPKAFAAAVSKLDTDDAVYLLEDLDEQEQREILQSVPAAERVALEEGLAYGEDTAGRMMQRELVAVPEFWTVAQTLAWLRGAPEMPDRFHEVFVVDPAFRAIGTLPLDRVLRAQPATRVGDIMEREQTLIPVAMDREQVALLFGKYGLLSAGVVDPGGRLVGVITVDDVVDVISEEAEEDLLRMGGVAETDLHRGIGETARRRGLWLLVNLVTAFIAAGVISLFDASIEQIVALAVLMPIVASMGGNAGTQAMTVAVRALAVHQLTAANALRVVLKEAAVGAVNGVAFAALVGTLTWLWFGSLALGLVIAAAMIVNLLVAGLFGAVIPLVLHRLDTDPAVASGIFLTTVTDVVGFFAFLGLATLLLL